MKWNQPFSGRIKRTQKHVVVTTDSGQPEIQNLLVQALEHHRASQWAEAERLYQRILEIHPNQPDALHFLGVLADQDGSHERAVDLISKAIKLKNNYPEAYNNLGNALGHLGKDEEAALAYKNAIKQRPNFSEAFNNLGNLLREQGLYDESAAAFRKALSFQPQNPRVHNNLGATLKQMGMLDDALTHLSKAIELNPDYAEAYNNLGNTLRRLGRHEEAIAAFTKATALKPGLVDVNINLGNVFMDQGKFDDAVTCYLKAIEFLPDYAEAYSNLGNALCAKNKLEEAAEAYKKAITLDPNLGEAHNNLGNVLKDQGKTKEALACFEKSIALIPEYTRVHSSLLFCMNYETKYSPEDIWRASQRWGELHGRHENAHTGPYPNVPDTERRLKIGYVSPDFRTHSVTYFFEPLLAAHDKETVETFCYAEVPRPDETSERLQMLADHWHPTVDVSAEEVAKQIGRDQIDILVDLAGHTSRSRLDVFSLCAAPVQISWLGYPNTTGMNAIKYRLTDSVADPPGESDNIHSEELIRLPHGFLCYGPPKDAPEITALPAQEMGHITFGSFNNLAKVSAEVVAAWAKVMHAVPASRMIIKSRQLADNTTRTLYKEKFAANGISADRVEFIQRTETTYEHLEWYGKVDIALDTLPYGGTTTTCEALWMGAPVVTLRGNRHAGRVGASLLTHMGLEELVADSIDAYVEKSAALAANFDKLAALRKNLRKCFRESCLMDREGFARDMEAAYRELWRRWCQGD